MWGRIQTILIAAVFISFPFQPISNFSSQPQENPPTIISVSPDELLNNLDATITLTGTGFQPGSTIKLGLTDLKNVTWVDAITMTATVPWGIGGGTYPITVTSPNGTSATLDNAVRVIPSIGVWTTDGPYGGEVMDLAVSPSSDQTAWAVIRYVGLYVSRNGGNLWTLVFADPSALGVTYGPGNPSPVYFWGSLGVKRSFDDGLSWQTLMNNAAGSFSPDPSNPNRLWCYTDTLRLSTDGGVTWPAHSGDLPANLSINLIVVDPSNSNVLYLATDLSHIYKSSDGGDHWVDSSSGLPSGDQSISLKTLAVDPVHSNILLASVFLNDYPAYRSSDSGQTWQPVAQSQIPDGHISDIAFSPVPSYTDRVFASFMGNNLVATSLDGGTTWSCSGTRTGDWMESIGLSPTSGIPAYLGGYAGGPLHTKDGGQTWEKVTEGITGLPIQDIAASPVDPARIYVAAEHAGGFMSDNSGHSWMELPVEFPAVFSVAADPVLPSKGYAGSARLFYRNYQDDAVWESIHMPQDLATLINSVEPSPSDPEVVYAGGRLENGPNPMDWVGIAWRSDDRGASWSILPFPAGSKEIWDLAVDSQYSQTVYAATSVRRGDGGFDLAGNGIYRTKNGGQTWDKLGSKVQTNPVISLAIDPQNPKILYAGGLNPDDPQGRATVLKSTDGGDSWSVTDLYQQLQWGWVPKIVVDPIDPRWVYAGTWEGLFQSFDAGEHWTRASGSLGGVVITGLTAASVGNRTIIYVATTGGLSSISQSSQKMQLGAAEYTAGGVYQFTGSHNFLYLPRITH